MYRVMCSCRTYCDPEELDVKDYKDGVASYKYVICPNCGLKVIVDLKFNRNISYEEYEIGDRICKSVRFT